MRNNGVPSGTSATTRARLLLAVAPADAEAFFPASTRAALDALADTTAIEPALLHDPAAFAAAMRETDILVTAWGVPFLDAARLDVAPRLAFVMNAASSLKHLVGADAWERGFPVSQAGAAMAPAVAEMSLTATLALLRRLPRLDHALRDGADWTTARAVARPQEIAGCPLGVVGASRTGRRYIEMCRALGADVRVYDPYLPAEDPLSAVAVDLPELLRTSRVLALHAPETDETRGMIGAAELAALADGSLLINTARPALLDDDALYAEVRSGRLDAALDVHAHEPLPTHDRWRELPNVLLTPHLGGATRESRQRAGLIVVDEVRRFLAGEPLEHAITRAAAERMG